jgi:hypothetical protein
MDTTRPGEWTWDEQNGKYYRWSASQQRNVWQDIDSSTHTESSAVLSQYVSGLYMVCVHPR